MAVADTTGVAERLRRSELAEAVRRERAVAILRRLPRSVVDPTVEALLAGGLSHDRVHVRLGGCRRRHRAVAGRRACGRGRGHDPSPGPGGCGRRGRRPVPRRADVSGGRGRASARARRAVRPRRAVADRDRHRVAAGGDVREAVPGRRRRRRLPERRAQPAQGRRDPRHRGRRCGERAVVPRRGRQGGRASRPPSSASPPRRTATSERSKPRRASCSPPSPDPRPPTPGYWSSTRLASSTMIFRSICGCWCSSAEKL